MEDLDRLGWADGLSFLSYGLSIGIRVSNPDTLDVIRDCLPPGREPALSPVVDYLYSLRLGGNGSRRGIRHFHQLYAGTRRLARTMDLDEVIEALEFDLDTVIAMHAQQRIFVHAGVVGWHGQAIMIPGRSRSGKSTLVAAMLRAGATYYSDEYAVLDAHGRVHPFPRPLSIRHPNGESSKVHAQEFDASTGTQPLPVGLVVVTEHQSGARWRPRQLSPGQALLALLDNTVVARIRPGETLPVLRHVVSQALALKGRRPEAQDVADYLLCRCDSQSHLTSARSRHEPASATRAPVDRRGGRRARGL